MDNLLQNTVSFSLIIMAIHTIINRPGMIFYWLLPYLERLPAWMHKPLFECLTCMSSFWGLMLWFAFGNGLSLWIIPQILAVAGLNYLLSLVTSVLMFAGEILESWILESEDHG